MHLFINNKRLEYPDNLTALQLLTHLELQEKKGMALAINNTVIPKGNWETHLINSEDNITIITATQGG